MIRRHRVLIGILAAAALAIGIWFTRGKLAEKGASAVEGGKTRAGQGRGRGSHGSGRGSNGSQGDSDETFRVTGTVRELGTTTPVGGGEVVFQGPGGETTTRAGENGRYEAFVHPGSYHVFVRGPGITSVVPRVRDRVFTEAELPASNASRAEAAPRLSIREDASGVDLEVRSVVTVTGRVANKSGGAIAHAVIRARGAERPVNGGDIVESDASGDFKLELPPGVYSIDASHPEYAGIAESGSTINVDPSNKPAPLALTMVAGCVVTGKVVGADGAPSDDGSLDVKRGADEFRPSSSLKKDGTFRWTTVDEGDVSLRAWAWMSPPTKEQTFHCTDGARFEATLEMPGAAPDLDGTLTSVDGSPLPFAFLDIVALSAGGVSQEERTDANGRWGVFTMPPGDYLLTAELPGEGFVERRVHVPSHEIDLVLGGTGAIAGTISGVPDGVVAMDVTGCSYHPPVALPTRPERHLVPVKDGKFRVDGVPACEVSVSTRINGDVVWSLPLTVKNRGEASLSLVPLPPAQPVAEVVPDLVIDGPADEAPPPVRGEPVPDEVENDQPAPQGNAAPSDEPDDGEAVEPTDVDQG